MTHRLSLPPATTPAAAKAYETTEPRISVLRETLEEAARRHPQQPAPADVVALVREALRPMAPLTAAIGVPPVLPLHGTPSFIGLHARLALAETHLDTFSEAYWHGQVDHPSGGWRLIPPADGKPTRARRTGTSAAPKETAAKPALDHDSSAASGA